MPHLLYKMFRNAHLPCPGDWTVEDDIGAYCIDNPAS
jgi:hypothetical protein